MEYFERGRGKGKKMKRRRGGRRRRKNENDSSKGAAHFNVRKSNQLRKYTIFITNIIPS